MRSNFTWSFAGNLVYAGGQWAILGLLAKLGSSEMLGQYAMALAITNPIVMLFHLNLRAILATDAGARYPFGDYVAARFATAAAGFGVIAVMAWIAAPGALAITILLLGLSQTADTVSDIYYGAMQRRERMDQIAWSMIARAILPVAALGVALSLTGNIVAAVAALALGRNAVLLAYDRPVGSAGEHMSRSGFRAELAIIRSALPLGLVLMLVSLNANLPRYAIERHMGTAELGAFAAVASLTNAGATVVNALGQTAMPRLARYCGERNWFRFRQLVTRLTGIALLLGVGGVVVAVVLGRIVLRLLYRPEYEAYNGLLSGMMFASIVSYVANAFGYVVTSVRAFDAQLPLFCAVAASCGIASWLLVPRFGLQGAVVALAVSACVQIGGQILILRRAVHRMGPAN
jgi:O-antigen/teichoic acid export membrane protein